MPAGLDWSPKLLVYGDMGKEGGSQSLPALYKEAVSGDYNAILHIGDFAYDLDSDGGEVYTVMLITCMYHIVLCSAKNGDEFMRRLQPIAACVPYMTTEGNHGQCCYTPHHC